MPPVSRTPLIVLALFAFACTDPSTGPDASTQADAGTIVDAGSVDAGFEPDAATTPDAGTAPDAGTSSPPAHEGEPCATYQVTADGDCVGEKYRWCDESTDTIFALDCGGSEIRGACGPVGPAFGCIVPQGVLCSVILRSGDFELFECGAGGQVSATLACDLSQGCVPTQATCRPASRRDCVRNSDCAPDSERCYIDTPGSPGQCLFNPVCDGNTTLVIDCTEDAQLQQWDCREQGGTGCVDGRCVGIKQGGPCDEYFVCGSGLTCVDMICR